MSSKTVTTTEEFDEAGRLTRRTVETITDEAEPIKYVPRPTLGCTCGLYRNWNSILPPPRCPVHDHYNTIHTNPWDKPYMTWNSSRTYHLT